MDTPTTNLAEPAQLDIPPAPDVLTAIAREAESDMPNLAKLAKMIQQDPALAAAVLRAANGIMRMRKIESVAQALQVIGLERTHQIVLHAMLHSTLGMPKNLRPSLWDELRVSAEAAADFARLLRTVPPPMAHTAALLHDTGFFLLARQHPDYHETLSLARVDPEKPFTEHEFERYKTHHAVVGFFLARRWGLAEPVALTINHHHDYVTVFEETTLPPQVPHLVSLIAMADVVAAEAVGIGRDKEWHKARGPVVEFLGLTEDEVDDMIEAEIAQQRTATNVR